MRRAVAALAVRACAVARPVTHIQSLAPSCVRRIHCCSLLQSNTPPPHPPQPHLRDAGPQSSSSISRSSADEVPSIPSVVSAADLIAEAVAERAARRAAEADREPEEPERDTRGMTPDEIASTGRYAEVGDIPRTGPFPRNPYEPLSPEEIACTDGASCPSYPWDHSAYARQNESARLMAALPLPRPLPPVYYLEPAYRSDPELRAPWQRLLHVFALVAATAGAAVVLLNYDDSKRPSRRGEAPSAERARKQQALEAARTPEETARLEQAKASSVHAMMTSWAARMRADLQRTPSEVRAYQMRKLGYTEDQLPEARRLREGTELLLAQERQR